MNCPGHAKPCSKPWEPLSTAALLLGAVALVWAMGGCSPPSARQGGFDSPDPASLMYAIGRAGEARDAKAVPQLVQALEHDDPAVRMMAITALHAITGQRMAYNPYQSDQARYPALIAWRQYASKDVNPQANRP